MRGRRIAFALIPTVLVFGLLDAAARVYERAERIRRAAAALPALPDIARRGDETLIYVYGESTVFGAPVPEVGFVRQMQYLAARRPSARPVRIVNLGVPGLDSSGLLAAFEATAPMHPDLAIVLCGHNEFLRPDVEPGPDSDGLAIVRVPASWLARAFPQIGRDRAAVQLARPVDRASGVFRRKEENYFENMRAVTRTAKDAGVRLLLATCPSNLRDWPPVFRLLHRPGEDPSYESTMAKALAALRRDDLGAVRAAVETAGGPLADDPMIRFLRGRVRLADGDERGAMEDLKFARDMDPVPLRASSRFNEFVRTLAGEQGALFCDLEQAVGRGNAPGFDLMADNCHPSPEGCRRIARALLDVASRAGIVPTAPAAAEPPLFEFLNEAGFAAGSPLEFRYLLHQGRYAMQPPYRDVGLAGRWFEEAAARHPSSWEAQANLAAVRFIQTRTAEGLAALRAAVDLHGGPLDLDDREATPFLKEAMAAAGVSNDR